MNTMKKKSNFVILVLLLLGLNLNAQSKLNYVKQKVGERLSEYVPIKFDYSVASSSYIDRMAGIKNQKASSLVSYQITDVTTESSKILKITGTFVVDKLDTYASTYTKCSSNVSFKFEATAKQILDDYEVIKIMYYDDKTHTESYSSWKELYNGDE